MTCLIFDTNEEIRVNMELVAYPNDEFKQNVIRILFLDLGFCYFVEKTCKNIYLASFKEEEEKEKTD